MPGLPLVIRRVRLQNGVEAWGGCVQTRHGLSAVPSETGLVLSFVTKLTSLDPAQILPGSKVWPSVPG